MGEFDLINRYFRRPGRSDAAVALGIGDDCALLRTTQGCQLAISSDMLVEGRHFFPDVAPRSLGHKALAVNLSDLAAMGARPLGFTLAVALPAIEEAWVREFTAGLFALADRWQCPLVGGDTTRGPLNICVTVFGELRPPEALRRDTARPGDDVWLSGQAGEARLALERRLGTRWAQAAALGPADIEHIERRLHLPTPRLDLGLALRGVAHAAIDVSDGLSGDLTHMLQASGVGAQLEVSSLPLPPALASLDAAQQLDCMANGGDDYELLFCAPPEQRDRVRQASEQAGVAVTRIGRIETAPGLRWTDARGELLAVAARSFDHFASGGAPG